MENLTLKIKLLVPILFCFTLTFSQKKETKKNILHGLGIEVGAGYGTLTHTFDDKSSLNKDTTSKRKELFVQPTVRISYQLFTYLTGPYHVDFSVFGGYYNFGGKSFTRSNGYKDILLFNSFEAGLMPEISRRDKIIISPSFKAQYIFNTEQKYFGTLNQPDSIQRQWIIQHNNDFFKKIAMNIGLNVKYKYKKITLAIEGWYGVSNLNALNLSKNNGILTVKENNYRLLIGYQF